MTMAIAGSLARALRVAAAGLLAAGACACSDNALTSPTNVNQLDGTWRLFQMTTPAGVHNETPTAGRFNVVFATGTMQVRADCNTCSATSTLAGNILTVGPLACTRAACASAPLDTQFTAALEGALTVRVNDRLLQLNNNQGGELRFER